MRGQSFLLSYLLEGLSIVHPCSQWSASSVSRTKEKKHPPILSDGVQELRLALQDMFDYNSYRLCFCRPS